MAGPPPDDYTIDNDAILWRRFPRRWWILDKNTGEFRLSSGAFQNGSEDKTAMSVTIAAQAPPPVEYIARYPGFGLAQITAGVCRQCAQTILRAPTADDPAHAHVVGKKSGSVQNALLAAAALLFPPGAVGAQ